jgi:hypothetical protein
MMVWGRENECVQAKLPELPMRWLTSKVSDSLIGGLTKHEQVAAAEIVETVKQEIQQICFLRRIVGRD